MSTKGFHSQGTAMCCVYELSLSNKSFSGCRMRIKMEARCGMTEISSTGGIRDKQTLEGSGFSHFDLVNE